MEGRSRMERWPQYLAAITATLSMVTTGCYIGWTSPTLPALKAPGSRLPISSDDASWIASFYLLGSIPGNVIAAFMVDSWGRKASMLVAGLPLSLGWLLVLVARHPYVLYAARFVAGLGQGIVYVVCPMYIGEIADKEIRGRLGSLIKLMVTLGELYAHALGPYVSYEGLAYGCALAPVAFILSFAWMPESPYYLAMRDRRSQALRSLAWLRPTASPSQLDEDLDLTYKSVVSQLSSRVGLGDLFKSRGNRRAALVCFGLQMVLQLSGIAAVESYTQEMLEESGPQGALLPASVAVILLSALQLLAGVGAAALVDRLGRRPLLLWTTLLAGLAHSASAGFCWSKMALGVDAVAGWGSLVLFGVIGYELIIALGLNPLPYMMLGEMFPANVKGCAVSLANVWASLLAFFVSKMYQVVSDRWGVQTSFSWFAFICFFGLVFIVLVVPETKGKSLLEIQFELNCPRSERKRRKLAENERRDKQPISVSAIA
ncbi:hypothetical protein QAD02_007064 [Eretmocerus hayati]|uniref:Uncharacterized protein n=1 Tax=Eretmocerus hayati TaxID=131215 RepID=A0ACC2N2N5_9HYME|nr:hypothetical protein QAD02_007064 [Eretmocerus hayati]